MDKKQEQIVTEQTPLLAGCKLYKGEEEPETKGPPTQKDEEEPSPVGPERTPAIVGALVPRTPWSTGLFQCFGTCDEHCSSDLEVCVLAFAAPCVLYGSNMERLEYPARGQRFACHCLQYSCNCMCSLGALLLWNFSPLALAFCPFPWSASRVVLRQKYNLEGHAQYCLGCPWPCGTPSDARMERCDVTCDELIRGCFHPFALAQEGRELRRRTLSPNAQSMVSAMAPPKEQSMTP